MRERSNAWVSASRLVVLTVLILLTVRTPAEAHGATGNYLSTVVGIDPPVPGLAATILSRDALLQLTNGSGREVLVLGYQAEPYLRFNADGVFANANSPAYYVNDARYSSSQIPESVDPEAEPEWKQVSDGSSYSWHDHRIHWMNPKPPPAVERDPGKRQLIFDWSVPLVVGGTPTTVRGRLEWVPTVDGTMWFGIAGILVFLGAGLVSRLARYAQRAYRVGAMVALVLGVAGGAEAVGLLTGAGGHRAVLRDVISLALAVGTLAAASHLWRHRDADRALTLAFAVAGLAIVAGLMRGPLVLGVILNSWLDILYPVAVLVQSVVGTSVAVLLAVVVRRERRRTTLMATGHQEVGGI